MSQAPFAVALHRGARIGVHAGRGLYRRKAHARSAVGALQRTLRRSIRARAACLVISASSLPRPRDSRTSVPAGCAPRHVDVCVRQSGAASARARARRAVPLRLRANSGAHRQRSRQPIAALAARARTRGGFGQERGRAVHIIGDDRRRAGQARYSRDQRVDRSQGMPGRRIERDEAAAVRVSVSPQATPMRRVPKSKARMICGASNAGQRALRRSGNR